MKLIIVFIDFDDFWILWGLVLRFFKTKGAHTSLSKRLPP